jgi:hypothetical protein
MFEPKTLRMSLAVLILVSTLGGGALAADGPTLASGTRIRAKVTETTDKGKTRTREVRGSLVDLGDSTLTMKPERVPSGVGTRSGSYLIIPRERIEELETSVRPSRRGQGALIGLGVGAIVGAMIGFADGDDPAGFMSFSAEAKAGMLAIVFAPVGAMIGALAAPGEQWDSVSAGDVRLGFHRGPDGGTGILLSMRF